MRPTRFSTGLGPEPGNAVAVVYVDHFQRETIGYLRREHAARYQQLILQVTAQGGRAMCGTKLFGGTRYKGNIGVWLDLEAPTILASETESSVHANEAGEGLELMLMILFWMAVAAAIVYIINRPNRPDEPS